jgi:hypothetical protein
MRLDPRTEADQTMRLAFLRISFFVDQAFYRLAANSEGDARCITMNSFFSLELL